MPCQDGGFRDNSYHNRYGDYGNYENISISSIVQDEMKGLRSRILLLEAAICAMFTELEKRGILSEIIDDGSKSGGINLKDIWLQHTQKDEERLTEVLNKFSEHEKIIIKRILLRSDI